MWDRCWRHGSLHRWHFNRGHEPPGGPEQNQELCRQPQPYTAEVRNTLTLKGSSRFGKQGASFYNKRPNVSRLGWSPRQQIHTLLKHPPSWQMFIVAGGAKC